MSQTSTPRAAKPKTPRKAKRLEPQIERHFFDHLCTFYLKNKRAIRASYPALAKQFLDHNDPDKNPSRISERAGGEPLRRPQFEALEIYVFLKEYAGNKRVYEIFDAWYNRAEPFGDREDLGLPTDKSRQGYIFAEQDAAEIAAWGTLFARMRAAALADPETIPPNMPAPPPNYIFALSMGVGKTRLMGVCILYEFLLAKKYPQHAKYAHNALVFAPDTTVRDALREIEQMDFGAYLPASHAHTLPVEIKPRVLDDEVTTLQLHDGGDFHIIISNIQKILVKKTHKPPSAASRLLKLPLPAAPHTGAWAAADALADELETEADLTYNQRFQKLIRAPNLAIYIDEAHHAFGAGMAANVGQADGTKEETAFRRTVRLLIEKLEKANSRVVGTFCYTGTPYADGKLFPEVVYYYGLKQAIDSRILKDPLVHNFKNIDDDFVTEVVERFVRSSCGRTYEGLRPKLAFFAKSIPDATDVLRPLVEKAAVVHGFSASSVLVNTSDEKTTTKDDERAFRLLDSPGSAHQFIILVGKGKEGWNCRSLFGVALFREPKSEVFILQATMRCLRAIDGVQHRGHIYLSDDNAKILDRELKKNFNMSLEQFGSGRGGKGRPTEVMPLPPPRPIKLRRIRYRWDLSNKYPAPGQDLGVKDLSEEQIERYTISVTTTRNAFSSKEEMRASTTEDLTARYQRMHWSAYQLVAECARYLNRSPVEIEQLLRSSKDGLGVVVDRVNQFNGLLWDHVIPKLFACFYDVKTERTYEDVILHLAPMDRSEPWLFHADPDLTVDRHSAQLRNVPDLLNRTFHVEPYCFDSGSEQTTFFDLVKHKQVKQVYFTGMLTAGQTAFVVQYIDSTAHSVRSYYPDFVVEDADGSWIIVEVKGDDKADEQVVRDKALAARELAGASSMRYAFLRSSLADDHRAELVLDPGALDEFGRVVSAEAATLF